MAKNKDNFINHPIFKVIREKDLESIEKILEQTPEVLTQHTDAGWSPIHEALFHNNGEVTRFLRDKLREVRTATDALETAGVTEQAICRGVWMRGLRRLRISELIGRFFQKNTA